MRPPQLVPPHAGGGLGRGGGAGGAVAVGGSDSSLQEAAGLQQQAAVFDPFRVVDPKYIDGGSSLSGQAKEKRSFPREVHFPGVVSGMEEPRQFARIRIDSGEVGTLVGVAVGARPAEVLQIAGSMMLPRLDVIDHVG